MGDLIPVPSGVSQIKNRGQGLSHAQLAATCFPVNILGEKTEELLHLKAQSLRYHFRRDHRVCSQESPHLSGCGIRFSVDDIVELIAHWLISRINYCSLGVLPSEAAETTNGVLEERHGRMMKLATTTTKNRTMVGAYMLGKPTQTRLYCEAF